MFVANMTGAENTRIHIAEITKERKGKSCPYWAIRYMSHVGPNQRTRDAAF
jgi:hypothetical protein